MKKILPIVTGVIFCSTAFAADWDGIAVPADPGAGNSWQLQSDLSDDFDYSAPAVGKSQTFYQRWADGFINSWSGPGLTEYHDPNSSVENGKLVIKVSRKPGTNKVYTGALHSKKDLHYPVYIETKCKITDQVLANAVWMLSADSTQEIDIVEAYGSSRPDQTWYAKRMHLSHHVFTRSPFQDYQPKDAGSWYSDGRLWRDQYSRIGVYWRDATHLEYYIDGQLVRTVSGMNMIDPNNYTNGSGLNKPMKLILDAEDQDWRSNNGIAATDAELSDPSKNKFYVDWVRVYKPVTDNGGSGGGDTGGGTSGVSVDTNFADFTSTGKDGASVSGDNHPGFNPSGAGHINFNTVGDWANYSITLPEAGQYQLELTAGSPITAGLGADITIDDVFVGHIAISNTGGWENYQTFSLANTVNIGAGTHTVHIQSAGSAQWQWNGAKIRFSKTAEADQGGQTPAPAQATTIEAENFTQTGGPYDGFQTYTQNGVTATNYNQRGDYAQYNFSLDGAGNYIFNAYLATPETGAALDLTIDGNPVTSVDVPNTGGWNSFQKVSTSSAITLTAGSHTLKVKSAGNTANTWEWNADKFELIPQ